MRYRLFFKALLLLSLFTFLPSRVSISLDSSKNLDSHQLNEIKIIDIKVDSYSFEPNEIKVKVNEPVKIRLRSVTSIIPHNFTLDSPDAGLQIDQDIPSGRDVTVSFTPTRTGEYKFYCSKKNIFANHRKRGMEGLLVVVE